MNALFLKELAEQTRRGMRGRDELGKAGGALCYGYRVVRRLQNGVMTTGEREINSEEAAVVRRIFESYAAGASPKQIAKTLNSEGVRGPQESLWNPSTIHGNPKRGVGMLNNERYIGRLVWNRQRFVKDPDTGKRLARLNRPSEWITKDVPELRVLSDDLWQSAKARQASVQRRWSAKEPRRFNQARRKKLVELVMEGVPGCQVKDELIAIGHRRDVLDASQKPPTSRYRCFTQAWPRPVQSNQLIPAEPSASRSDPRRSTV